MEATKDQEFLEYVVKSLVNNPSAVSSERKVDEMGVLLTLTVDPQDMGQIIGRRGQTARAVRTLLRVVGAKNNARVNLRINEPEERAGGMGNASSPSSALNNDDDTDDDDLTDPTSAADDLHL
jgi:predicted RNA-binding protein YlqC (UPF0109 family)